MPNGKSLLSAFLVFHFLALALNNLPWSPFVATLYPAYGWYVVFTGQVQDWGMYTHPDRKRTEITLSVHYADERKEWPWGVSTRMDARKLYFLEGILVRNGREEAAKRFLDSVLARYPETDHPTRIELVMERFPIEDQGDRTPAEPIAPTHQEIVRYR